MVGIFVAAKLTIKIIIMNNNGTEISFSLKNFGTEIEGKQNLNLLSKYVAHYVLVWWASPPLFLHTHQTNHVPDQSPNHSATAVVTVSSHYFCRA